MEKLEKSRENEWLEAYTDASINFKSELVEKFIKNMEENLKCYTFLEEHNRSGLYDEYVYLYEDNFDCKYKVTFVRNIYDDDEDEYTFQQCDIKDIEKYIDKDDENKEEKIKEKEYIIEKLKKLNDYNDAGFDFPDEDEYYKLDKEIDKYTDVINNHIISINLLAEKEEDKKEVERLEGIYDKILDMKNPKKLLKNLIKFESNILWFQDDLLNWEDECIREVDDDEDEMEGWVEYSDNDDYNDKY